MVWFARLLFVVFIVLSMSACTIPYKDSNNRKLSAFGLAGNYQVSRWHSRVYARDSHFFVYANCKDKTMKQLLEQAVVKHFDGHFSEVSNDDNVSALAVVSQAAAEGAHFLIFIDVVEIKKANFHRPSIKNSKSRPSSPQTDSLDSAEGFDQLSIMLTIKAINSLAVVDKISIDINRHLEPISNVQDMLRNPLIKLVNELSDG